MNYYTHEFEADIQKYDFGKYFYTVVYLPEAIAAELPFKDFPRLRVEAEVDDLPVNGAFMPDHGVWYLLVPRRMLKELGKTLGDTVTVRFKVADQDAVEVPEALQAMLDADAEMRAAWEQLTAGKRRGLAYMVGNAKSAATIAKRLAALREDLLQ